MNSSYSKKDRPEHSTPKKLVSQKKKKKIIKRGKRIKKDKRSNGSLHFGGKRTPRTGTLTECEFLFGASGIERNPEETKS